jgi:hypothetical protein
MPAVDQVDYLKEGIAARSDHIRSMLRALRAIDAAAIDALSGKISLQVGMEHVELYSRTAIAEYGKAMKAFKEHRRAQRAERRINP